MNMGLSMLSQGISWYSLTQSIFGGDDDINEMFLYLLGYSDEVNLFWSSFSLIESINIKFSEVSSTCDLVV